MQPQYVTTAAALATLTAGERIVTAMAAAEPAGFFNGIHEQASQTQGLVLYCANPTRAYPCFSDPGLAGHLTIHPMFITSVIKNHQQLPHVHYIPQHLSQWSRNILAAGPIDVFWGSCSTPDPRGFVSLGVSLCFEKEILSQAKRVILEVNPHMPVTFGASTVSLDQVDYLIDNPQPLPTIEQRPFDATDRLIAQNVAALVPDGATIQLGIGAIPNALTQALATKNDLGVHTEMINDTIMKLAQLGVINGRRKTKWPEKIVGAFAYGSRELYDFLDGNPSCEFQHAAIVNNPLRIGKNPKMTSINGAVEIDITGQVCSESLGHRELSGVGGATETHTGAQLAEGGRGIIAMRSQTSQGGSKIVSELQPGAKVSISRNDLDTVVTEWGAARLKGKSVAERARLLVSLAHPDHRAALEGDARRFGYW